MRIKTWISDKKHRKICLLALALLLVILAAALARTYEKTLDAREEKEDAADIGYNLLYEPEDGIDPEDAAADRREIEHRIELLQDDISYEESGEYGLTIHVGETYTELESLFAIRLLLMADHVGFTVRNDVGYAYCDSIEFCGDDNNPEYLVTMDAKTMSAWEEASAGLPAGEDMSLLYYVHDQTGLNSQGFYYSMTSLEKTGAEGDNQYRIRLWSGASHESEDSEVSEDSKALEESEVSGESEAIEDSRTSERLKYLEKVVQFGTLSSTKNCSISSKVSWLDPGKGDAGQNQFLPSSDPEEFPENYTKLYYYSYHDRITLDEEENRLNAVRAKLDVTGEPYALGEDPYGMFVIALPCDSSIIRFADTLCDQDDSLMLIHNDCTAYLSMEEIMVNEKGITVFLTDDETQALRQSLQEDPGQPVILSVNYEESGEIARIQLNADQVDNTITLTQYPEDMPWAPDFLSAAILWLDDNSYGNMQYFN